MIIKFHSDVISENIIADISEIFIISDPAVYLIFWNHVDNKIYYTRLCSTKDFGKRKIYSRKIILTIISLCRFGKLGWHFNYYDEFMQYIMNRKDLLQELII